MDKISAIPALLTRVLRPLFEALDPSAAMPELCPKRPQESSVVCLVEQILQDPAFRGRDDLAAGLWLYVDELDRSHAVSQALEDETGSYWHAIMHRREGDFANSLYWLRRTGSHPVWPQIENFDPAGFVREVEKARGRNLDELVTLQRQEWEALFVWCCSR